MVFGHLLLFVSQGSSICKAAIHAGVVGADGGLVDVVALDKRKSYVGVLKNGIQSERCFSFLLLLLAPPHLQTDKDGFRWSPAITATLVGRTEPDTSR